MKAILIIQTGWRGMINNMETDLTTLLRAFGKIGLQFNVKDSGIEIRDGFKKTEFVGINAISFDFEPNGDFKKLMVEE